MAMTLVSTTTVGSGGAASIEFTNIPQTGKDLLILCSSRSTSANIEASLLLELNGSTSNISGRELTGNGSTVASSSPTFRISNTGAANTTADTFGNSSTLIANYTTSANKSISTDGVFENNATAAWQTITASTRTVAEAITSLRLSVSGNFTQHSTASLYIIS